MFWAIFITKKDNMDTLLKKIATIIFSIAICFSTTILPTKDKNKARQVVKKSSPQGVTKKSHTPQNNMLVIEKITIDGKPHLLLVENKAIKSAIVLK
jgi:hypothetical protein